MCKLCAINIKFLDAVISASTYSFDFFACSMWSDCGIHVVFRVERKRGRSLWILIFYKSEWCIWNEWLNESWQLDFKFLVSTCKYICIQTIHLRKTMPNFYFSEFIQFEMRSKSHMRAEPKSWFAKVMIARRRSPNDSTWLHAGLQCLINASNQRCLGLRTRSHTNTSHNFRNFIC